MDENSYNFIKRSVKKYKSPLQETQNVLNSSTIRAPTISQMYCKDGSTSTIEKIIKAIKKDKPYFSPTLIPSYQFSKIKQIGNKNKDKRKIFRKKYPENQSKKNNKDLTFDLVAEYNSISDQDLQKQTYKNYPKSKEEIAIQNLYKLSIAESHFPTTNQGNLSGWTTQFNYNTNISYKKNQDKTNRSTILDQRKRKSYSTKKEKRDSHLDLFDFKQNLKADSLQKGQHVNQRNIITQIQPEVFVRRQNYIYFKNSLVRNRKKPILSCRNPCQQFKNTSNLLGNKILWAQL